GAQRQHANDRQIQVCAKRARLRRALEEITPERTVSTLALQMALADLSGDLTEDADVGDRIVALRENELEVRGDRRPQSGHRVGARAESVDRLAGRRGNPIDAEREDFLDDLLLRIEVVVEASRLETGEGGNVFQRDRGVAVAAEGGCAGVEDTLARAR